MKRTVLEARNPRWNDVEQTTFDIEVKFAEIVENGTPVFIDFTSSPLDQEPHAVQIYSAAINGDYGTIEDFEE